MRLEFRKTIKDRNLIGFHGLEIIISPHYHFNQYKHNGNDFKASDCIKTISDILDYLGIKKSEYMDLKVVNIEFGVNIIPLRNTTDIIKGLWYHSTKAFKNSIYVKCPYFKVAHETSKYLTIKAYHKGLQCHNKLNSTEIDINTFRFEIKSKEAKKVNKYGIVTVLDLLNIENYKFLVKEIIKEWNNILLINIKPDYRRMQSDVKQFIKKASNIEFWNGLQASLNKNTFNNNKERYQRILNYRNNLHQQIRLQIEEKLEYLLS